MTIHNLAIPVLAHIHTTTSCSSLHIPISLHRPVLLTDVPSPQAGYVREPRGSVTVCLYTSCCTCFRRDDVGFTRGNVGRVGFERMLGASGACGDQGYCLKKRDPSEVLFTTSHDAHLRFYTTYICHVLLGLPLRCKYRP